MENKESIDIDAVHCPGVKGKNFVVFGGTGTIGGATAKLLVDSGANVLVAGRDRAKLNSLKEKLNVDTCMVDASEEKAIDSCITNYLEKNEKVDGVVNCIGSIFLKPAHLTSDENWSDTIDTNLTSSFKILRAASSAMMRTGGSIVFITSSAAQVGLASHEAIAAAKAGLIGLTLSAAATYARRGIRINCVSPGLVKTQMTRQIVTNETSKQASEAMHALGRLGEPEDIANSIVWLLSSSSSWVTGQVLSVDGGLSKIRPKGR